MHARPEHARECKVTALEEEGFVSSKSYAACDAYHDEHVFLDSATVTSINNGSKDG